MIQFLRLNLLLLSFLTGFLRPMERAANKVTTARISVQVYTDRARIEFENVRGASKYELRYGTEGETVKTVISPMTIIELSNLKPGREYHFEGRVLKDSEWSDWSVMQKSKTADMSATFGTYNILSAVYDNVFPEHTWDTRKKAMAELILREGNRPDILGIQEGMDDSQVKELANSLKKVYDVHSNPRANSPRAIFWNKKRFGMISFNNDLDLLDDSVSGYTSNRYATHVKLRERSTGREILVFNIHAPSSYSGNKARIRELLAYNLASISRQLSGRAGDLPVIITGDFNSLPLARVDGSPSPHAVLLANGFMDSYESAYDKTDAAYSSHDRITTGISTFAGQEPKRIDFIYAYPAARVRSDHYRLLIDLRKGSGSRLQEPIPSDHRPVMSTLHFWY